VLSIERNSEAFAKDVSVEIGNRPSPGETCEISVDLKVPSTAGPHKAVFSLASDGKRFGTIFYIEIVAEQGGSSSGNPSEILKSSFVDDITIPDGSRFKTGTTIVKTWRLKNSGNAAWPTGTRVLASENNRVFGKTVSEALEKLPLPGQTCDVTLELQVPSVAGSCTASFSLATKEGKRFGTKFFTQIIATEAESKTRIRVFIKSLSGETSVLEVKSSDTVALVKAKVEEKTGTPAKMMRLVLKDKQLEDHRTVAWYKMVDDCVLYKIVKSTSDFKISVMTLMGKKIDLEVSSDNKICALTQQIQDREGIAPEKMRLIYKGKGIQDSLLTLGELGIREGHVIILLMKMRDIGVFGEHLECNIGRDLLCSGKDKKRTSPSDQDTSSIIHSIGASPGADFVSSGNERILTGIQCARLRRHLDRIHGHCVHLEQDLKIDITVKELEDLVGSTALQRIESIFPRANWQEIKLRRCVAHGKHINFHTDFAERTMQITLNDDTTYMGGKLVFVNSKGVHIPSRGLGSFTIHPKDIAHGVTRLDAGIRYGLFFLQL